MGAGPPAECDPMSVSDAHSLALLTTSSASQHTHNSGPRDVLREVSHLEPRPDPRQVLRPAIPL